MSGYTPGPWSVVELPHTGLIGVKRGDRTLCLESEVEGDAYLIAAAPDLLEALEKITDEYSYAMYDERSIKEEDLPEVVAARAAIARAKGEK